jgi:hypothetical protein
LRKENFWIFGTPAAVRQAVDDIDQQLAPESVQLPGPAHITAIPGEEFVPDCARGVTVQPTVRWWPGPRSESCSMYFGTGSNVVATAQPGSVQCRATVDSRTGDGSFVSGSYYCGTLQPGQTYYWRVDSSNSFGITIGPVWRFTTGEGGCQ